MPEEKMPPLSAIDSLGLPEEFDVEKDINRFRIVPKTAVFRLPENICLILELPYNPLIVSHEHDKVVHVEKETNQLIVNLADVPPSALTKIRSDTEQAIKFVRDTYLNYVPMLLAIDNGFDQAEDVTHQAFPDIEGSSVSTDSLKGILYTSASRDMLLALLREMGIDQSVIDVVISTWKKKDDSNV